MDSPHPESRTELIAGLMLEAGGLMEDASPEFALALPSDRDDIAARINKLTKTAEQLQNLANASRTLLALDEADQPSGD